MPKKAERIPLNLRLLREESLLSRPVLAGELGLSIAILVALETGQGSPRIATLYQLSLVLARHLEKRAAEVFDALIPEEAYTRVEPIYQVASAHLANKSMQAGNLKAKRQFAKRQETLVYDEPPPESVNFSRAQKLYARSRYSKVELVDIAQISLPRLSTLFGQSAERTGNMTLGVFLRLTAALAPVYGKGIKETAFYLLEVDLEQLDALYQERAEKNPNRSA